MPQLSLRLEGFDHRWPGLRHRNPCCHPYLGAKQPDSGETVLGGLTGIGVFGCKRAALLCSPIRSRVQGVFLLNFDCSEMLTGLQVCRPELSGKLLPLGLPLERLL